MPSLEWTGVHEFVGALEGTVARAQVETRAAVLEAAALLERKAKENASGRPGPNVITGRLRSSIGRTPAVPWGVKGWETRVRPIVIYSRRIELGFQGTDSRGRKYNQPPYAYFIPAYEHVRPEFAAVYAKHMRMALGL